MSLHTIRLSWCCWLARLQRLQAQGLDTQALQATPQQQAP